MSRYIQTDKEQDNLFMPFKLRDQIVEGSLAATIQYMVDTKIDISGFDRKIHNFAVNNIAAMAICENQSPDFTVIADFIAEMSDQIKTVFINILLVAEEMKILGDTTFAIDGCKLPSNAAKGKSGTFGDLRKKKQEAQRKISAII